MRKVRERSIQRVGNSRLDDGKMGEPYGILWHGVALQLKTTLNCSGLACPHEGQA